MSSIKITSSENFGTPIVLSINKLNFTNLRFLVKLEIKGTEVVEMLKEAYEESAMKTASIYEWVRRFQEGREDVEYDAPQESAFHFSHR
ncbi:hypothetical protein WN48_01968 [Eufriesea mexicana]|nr:hypothetical protein WN48_01968 [Eufriesea mexicana]